VFDKCKTDHSGISRCRSQNRGYIPCTYRAAGQCQIDSRLAPLPRKSKLDTSNWLLMNFLSTKNLV
jgi:hypothetical protein